ncbi:MAG TPA: hypothetical protein VHW23_41745 [Kofleriaceae bacterium]|jgi:hypothetical protein|nr:hypothetical protein [Kofleriaceae bacterium]
MASIARNYRGLLVVQRDGRPPSVIGPADDLTADDLVAVVVLWTPEAARSWVGWLMTAGQRALRFSAADLEDGAFRRWLSELPGWTPQRMTLALLRPGIHRVWQREAMDPSASLAGVQDPQRPVARTVRAVGNNRR